MTLRADAHIHLFAGGYQEQSSVSRPGIAIDEAACYHSLAQDFDVTKALVVGYGGEAWCRDNNSFLRDQLQHFDWIQPTAYVPVDMPLSLEELEKLQQQGFVGVSLFVFGDEVKQLEKIPDRFWAWLETHQWLLSVNSEKTDWTAWHAILKRFPALRLLVSHLGLPPATGIAPTPQQAAETMQSVTTLSNFSGVFVKLSGFYALTVPGHDYPHAAAWPYVEQLVEAFSSHRLLWASDFTPCLDWVSFPQTFDLFQKMPFLNDEDVERICGKNLLALLEAIK